MRRQSKVNARTPCFHGLCVGEVVCWRYEAINCCANLDTLHALAKNHIGREFFEQCVPALITHYLAASVAMSLAHSPWVFLQINDTPYCIQALQQASTFGLAGRESRSCCYTWRVSRSVRIRHDVVQ